MDNMGRLWRLEWVTFEGEVKVVGFRGEILYGRASGASYSEGDIPMMEIIIEGEGKWYHPKNVYPVPQ
jgi:hypothetical protein